MPDSTPVDIISDAPEADSVVFGFDAYARTISGLIANKNNKTPLVIGIYGPWGSGKTTLMETVKRLLQGDGYANRGIYRKCKTVWFQAWKYDKEDEILAALIEEIFKTMKQDNFFESVKAELEEIINRLNPFKALGKAIKPATGIDITDFFSQLEYKNKLGFYDTFQEFFDRLLWTYTNLRPKLTGSEAPDDSKGVLAVFIDDLDRCPRERIIKVLETIKLFMDKKGCIFVIGAANEIIEKALADTYGREDACRFMEKIVQVTFKLPQIPADDFKPLVEKMDPMIQENLLPHLELIIPAMQNNPRQFKRFLNNLNLLESLLTHSGIDIDFNPLLFWSIIDLIYPQLAKDIKEHHEILYTLQDHTKSIAEEIGEKERWEIPPETLKPIPQSFHGYVQNKQLVDIVNKFVIERSQLQRLLTFSGIVEGPEEIQEEKEARKEYLKGFGDMVDVPAGVFKFGDEKREVEIDRPFQIDIYPVTNSQFGVFIRENGYEDEKYWSDAGWQWRQKENISLPRFCDDEKWNPVEHPVVGVSWFEADAFARWAGKELPTEEQWERAARGTDGRQNPWGDEFDKEKCNTEESGIGKTTRVTRYPNGISPVGCYDMAGNVWEWTKSFYGETKDRMALRGGSWDVYRLDALCAYRFRDHPFNRNDDVGFRCARTLR